MTKFELAEMMGLVYLNNEYDPMYGVTTFYYEFHSSYYSLYVYDTELSSLEGSDIKKEALEIAHEKAAVSVFAAIGQVVKEEGVLW